MAKYTIWHNPRCSKSRETLKMLGEKGIHPEVKEYLKENPTEEEIREVLMMLNIAPEELVRKTEELYKTRLKGLTLTDNEWIRIMAENPSLIERPVVIKGKKAVLGRPPEKVLELVSPR